MTRLQTDGELIDARTIRFERVLPGPIERVWSYLTDSEKRGRWLASGEMELRIGGRVELRFHNASLAPRFEPAPEKYKALEDCGEVTGRITRYEPRRLLAYTWGPESEVTFELSPQGDDVRLVVTHARLGSRDAMVSVAGGWHAHLDVLRDVLGSRTPAPFWPAHTALESVYETRIPH